MSLQRHLVIFVKAPRRGQVKTRLASGIGAGAATAFYRQQTAALLRKLDNPRRWLLWLAVAPDSDMRAKFWPLRLRRFPQGGGDLGRRMQRAFDCLPPGPVVLVGTDIPDMTRAHIAAAFAALGAHDVVFGPASDGGYWLVGLRRRPRLPTAFHNVRWSSKHALTDTLSNLGSALPSSPPGLTRGSSVDARLRGHDERRNRRVAFIDELSDVDTLEDYWRWREAQPALRFSCSRSRGNSSTKLHGRKR